MLNKILLAACIVISASFAPFASEKGGKAYFEVDNIENGYLKVSKIMIIQKGVYKEVDPNTWNDWLSSALKSKVLQNAEVVQIYNKYSSYEQEREKISAAIFFTPKNVNLFNLRNLDDWAVYKKKVKDYIDINTLLARSLSSIEEPTIVEVIKEYPANNYKDLLIARYKELLALRIYGENQAKERREAFDRALGNYLKDVGNGIKASLESPSSTSQNSSTSTSEYEVVSKRNAGTISITRTDINNMLKVKSHCNNAKHRTWDKNGGFNATLANSDFTKQTVSNTVEGDALEVRPTFPAIYTVSYTSTNGNVISATIKFQKPGYYNVELYPELGK